MSAPPTDDRLTAEERLLREARERGPLATLGAFVRLSGPGWLQSAITLGGGSLASALYLGVLTGYSMLWLQVVAMLLGVVMLAAIGYVTLSTGERPFGAMCRHVSPVLGWGWLAAVMLANLVWALPQFSLGTAALQQNLVPALEGTGGKVVACGLILALSTAVIWFYDSGARGVRLFEWVLKAMVGVVVVSFFGVVVTLASSEPGLPWREIFSGLVPDPSMLNHPAPALRAAMQGTGEFAGWWRDRVVGEQHSVMIAAAATAVGINMTFLLPYSMLRKGWGRPFRGLAVFDLLTGLLVPFALATGCVVIASASQFHGHYDERLVSDAAFAARDKGFSATVDARLAAQYEGEAYSERSVKDMGAPDHGARVARAFEELPEADLRLAAMLVKRDAFSLADALEPFTGRAVAQVVFGLGVLAMAVSTAIILMLISGFAFCEAFGTEMRGRPLRLGALAAGLTGALGPFLWSKSLFWLAVPTSNFGMALLPIAYWTFFLMMNSPRLLGDAMPRGARRVRWNALMLVAAGVATFASLHTVHRNLGWKGDLGIALFLVLAFAMHRRGRSA